jgi:UMF1 family MFS transporter
MLITAAIYGAAACATFALLPERAQPKTTGGELGAWQQLRATYRQARAYRDFMWLLVCTVCYQGGVAVAITLAAIYAEQVIGFVASETMVLIFVLNVAAAIGAFRSATSRTASATRSRSRPRWWRGSRSA